MAFCNQVLSVRLAVLALIVMAAAGTGVIIGSYTGHPKDDADFAAKAAHSEAAPVEIVPDETAAVEHAPSETFALDTPQDETAINQHDPAKSIVKGVQSVRLTVPTEEDDIFSMREVPKQSRPGRGVAINAEPLPGEQAYGASLPRIAIVIDDLGPNRSASAKAIDLDPAITLALLPYADGLEELIKDARAAGHELILHMPMEPLGNGAHDPGPNALLVDLSAEEVLNRLSWALKRLPGVRGLNNHMGSKFTADRTGMGLVLSEAKARGLYFLDSRTTAESVVASVAETHGVPTLTRDVFLDNQPNEEAIATQLKRAETIALESGQAIVIGHPYDATISVLKTWSVNALRRGFLLVPLSELLPQTRLSRAEPLAADR